MSASSRAIEPLGAGRGFGARATGRRVLALARFALRTNVRMWITRAGLAGAAAVILLGSFLSWRHGGGWRPDPDLSFLGWLTGMLFVMRSGLEEQNQTGLTTFLRHNLAAPGEHALAGALALVATLALYTGFAFVVMLAGGDAVGSAAWRAWFWLLVGAAFLPFIPMVEAVARFRLPAVLPALFYLALLVVLSLTLGETRATALFGASADPAVPASSLPVAARAGAILLGGFTAYVGGTMLLDRVRRWRRERG